MTGHGVGHRYDPGMTLEDNVRALADVAEGLVRRDRDAMDEGWDPWECPEDSYLMAAAESMLTDAGAWDGEDYDDPVIDELFELIPGYLSGEGCATCA